MLKILQARLQQYMNEDFPDVQAGFRKGRGARDQIANIHWIIEKGREFKENTYFCFTVSNPLTLWITTKYGKFLKRWEYQTTLPASRKICMQVKKQQLEPDMEQWTSSKLGKECIKAIYCHLAYSTYMQSTSCKMLGWMKFKLESDCWENINNLKYADDTTLMAESEEELKSLLMKVKEESEKHSGN